MTPGAAALSATDGGQVFWALWFGRTERQTLPGPCGRRTAEEMAPESQCRSGEGDRRPGAALTQQAGHPGLWGALDLLGFTSLTHGSRRAGARPESWRVGPVTLAFSEKPLFTLALTGPGAQTQYLPTQSPACGVPVPDCGPPTAHQPPRPARCPPEAQEACTWLGQARLHKRLGLLCAPRF